MKTDKGVLTDEQIAEAFEGTYFGNAKSRRVLRDGVLSRLVGYHTGWTVTQIMRRLGLITEKNRVTAKGRSFLHCEFYKKPLQGEDQ